MAEPGSIIIGSGINALVAAALFGKKGKKILLLERNDRIGQMFFYRRLKLLLGKQGIVPKMVQPDH